MYEQHMTRERDYGSLRGEKFDSRDLRDPRRHHVYDLTRQASVAARAEKPTDVNEAIVISVEL